MLCSLIFCTPNKEAGHCGCDIINIFMKIELLNSDTTYLGTQLQHLHSGRMWNALDGCYHNAGGSLQIHCTEHAPRKLDHGLGQRRHNEKHYLHKPKDKDTVTFIITERKQTNTYQLGGIPTICRLLKHQHCPTHHHTLYPRHCWCTPPPYPLLEDTHCGVVLCHQCRMHCEGFQLFNFSKHKLEW